MNPGDPGPTREESDAARHGGGHPWLPGVYDPETHLYLRHRNPTPAYTSLRGDGR
jgi:alcohol dehydrogenase (cytochrome c)